MQNSIFFALLLACISWSCGSPSQTATTTTAPPPPQAPAAIPFDSSIVRFQKEIDAFAEADSQAMPPEDAVLFTGSSSVRLWKTMKEDMAPIPVVNRGFGGSTMRELNYYIEQLIRPYNPLVVVVYEGDNDITDESVSPEDVMRDIDWYRQWMEFHFPETQTYFLGVKPSLKRKNLLKKAQQTNGLIASYVADYPNLHYIDIATPLMLNDSTIRDDIFIEDDLHLNAKGYALWTETIKPVIGAAVFAE